MYSCARVLIGVKSFTVCSLVGCSLLNAAAPCQVSEILKKHEKYFLKVINPRQSLLRLSRKGVITEDIKLSIDNSNTEDAKEILYSHLECHASVDTLREYCEMAIKADGFPNMQKLGRKIKEELLSEVG